MNVLRRFLAGALFLLMATLPAHAAQQPSKELDAKYGALSLPAYVKHYEVTKKGEFWVNPYLQVATNQTPGLLDPKLDKSKAPYNYMIDADGNVRLNFESDNPYGRTYEKGAIRPEDKSRRRPGWTEKDGHTTTLGGEKGRIGGEILFQKDNTWLINNKSGRYSNHNPDRTPEQLLNAVKRIEEVINPGGGAWGEVHYLVRYAPQKDRAALLARPDIKYYRPDSKSSDIMQKDPYLVLRELKK